MGKVRVLGTTEIDDGAAVLDGSRPRRLLALLAIRPGRAVPAEQLADELWEGSPPNSSAAALRVHVNVLRRALEPDRPRGAPSRWLPSRSGGYALEVDVASLDALAFAHEVEAAHSHVDAGDLDAAIERFTLGLALWRGDAYADTRTLLPVLVSAQHLDRQRLEATEQLATVLLARGDARRAVETLTPALAAEPGREALVGPMMLALYRLGRPVEALRRYTDLARTLDDDFGLAPGAELRALEAAILVEDPALEWLPPTNVAVVVDAPDRAPGRFVGRRRELDRIRARVDTDEQRPVLVTGPAGIGKTALVTQVIEGLRSDEVRVLVGCCAELGGEYQPFTEMLTELAADGELEPTARADLAPLLRNSTTPDDTDDAGAARSRFELFEAVATALAATAAPRTVLVIEDVHWLDRASVGLLRFLTRGTLGPDVTILATMRDDELAPNEDLARHLDAIFDSTTRVALTGLERDEVTALLRTMAPARVAAQLVAEGDALHRATAGNPLFVAELVRDRLERSDDPRAITAPLDPSPPSDLQGLVTRRFERLAPSTRRVLGFAALTGSEVDVDLLVSATDLEESEVLDAVDEALDARILVPPTIPRVSVSFLHDVQRAAIAATIDPATTRGAHAVLAHVLRTSEGADPVRVAIHCLRAEDAIDGATARAAMLAAGAFSMEQFAFEDAATWFDHALARIDAADAWSRAETAHRLATAAAAAGDRESARRAWQSAAADAGAAGDPELLADIAVANLGPILIPNYEPDQVALVDDALAVVPVDDVVRRIALLNAKAMTLYFTDHAEERQVGDEALRIGEVAGGRPYAVALAMQHRMLGHEAGDADTRRRIAEHAWREALSSADDEFALARERHWLNELLIAGRFADVDTALAPYGDRIRALRSNLGRYQLLALRATLTIARGDHDLGEQLANGARDLGERYDIADSLGAHLLHLFVIRYQQGRLAELPPQRQREAGPDHTTPAGLALAACACAETGHADLARPILDRALIAGTIPRDSYWLAAMALLAGPTRAIGTRAQLEFLDDALGETGDPIVVFGTTGAVIGVTDQWRGVVAAGLGDGPRARTLLEHAVATAQQVGLPDWQRRAERDLAEVVSDS